MTAPSTSTAPVVHDDDLEDLEDIGGAETAEASASPATCPRS